MRADPAPVRIHRLTTRQGGALRAPGAGAILRLAAALHARGEPWQGAAWGWPVSYVPAIDIYRTAAPYAFWIGDARSPWRARVRFAAGDPRPRLEVRAPGVAHDETTRAWLAGFDRVLKS